MSRASIVGAYNTKFGNHVKKDRETGQVTDLASLYDDLMLEAGRGAPGRCPGLRRGDRRGSGSDPCAPGDLRQPGAPGCLRHGDRPRGPSASSP